MMRMQKILFVSLVVFCAGNSFGLTHVARTKACKQYLPHNYEVVAALAKLDSTESSVDQAHSILLIKCGDAFRSFVETGRDTNCGEPVRIIKPNSNALCVSCETIMEGSCE